MATFLFGQAAAVSRSDLYVILAMALLAGSVVLLMYKELLVVTFDPTFARVQGWPVAAIDLLLMTLVALVTIIGLPAVGVVLMAALLIIPPAAARFWTDRLGQMVLLAAGIGATSAILGTAISAGWIPLGIGNRQGPWASDRADDHPKWDKYLCDFDDLRAGKRLGASVGTVLGFPTSYGQRTSFARAVRTY